MKSILFSSAAWIALATPGLAQSQLTYPHLDDENMVVSATRISARIDECDRAVAIVMSHSLETDKQNLDMLLSTRACYIGVLGPRVRTVKLMATASF